MGKYLVQDLLETIRYVPWGLLVALGVWAVVQLINRYRKKQGKVPCREVPIICFFSYLGLLLIITYWSRESGDISIIDWQIGSTLRINNRNTALWVENVLLFVPYGFCFAWCQTKKEVLLPGICLGFFTSLCIEILQLVTGRGVFQIDDIITNTLGCFVGVLLFKVFSWFVPGLYRKPNREEEAE